MVFEVKVSNLPESTTEEEVQSKMDSLSNVKANQVKLLKTKEGQSKGVCFLKYSLEDDQKKVLELSEVVFGENTVAIDVPNKHVRGEGQNSQRRRRTNRDGERERDGERDGGERRRYNNRENRGENREGGARREFNGERKEREVVAGDTVFVGNLAFAVKHDELKDFFDSCGSIVAVRIAMRDELSRGFGYVQFKSVEGAKAALSKNGAEMNGRTIRVNYQYSDNANRDSRPRNGDRRDNRPRNNYRGRDREAKQE